jgi:hypothetical protein
MKAGVCSLAQVMQHGMNTPWQAGRGGPCGRNDWCVRACVCFAICGASEGTTGVFQGVTVPPLPAIIEHKHTWREL